MLAYLVMLHDPSPPPFIGIEEPENFLHPRLLPELAEECRARKHQHPDARHYAFAVLPQRATTEGGAGAVAPTRRATPSISALPICQGCPSFVEHGALLGHLWMEAQLGVGDPLINQGGHSLRQGGV